MKKETFIKAKELQEALDSLILLNPNEQDDPINPYKVQQITLNIREPNNLCSMVYIQDSQTIRDILNILLNRIQELEKEFEEL